MLQSIGYAINLQYGATGQAIVVGSTFFMITTVIVLTAGTVFVMWLGERITEKGIGNGISLVIFSGIIVQPADMSSDLRGGQLQRFRFSLLILLKNMER